MYEDFLKTDDEIFINADSDLIYRPGWLDIAEQLLPQTDGLLSLYNSRKHPFIQQVNEQLGIKAHLGSAGTIFNREIAQYIVDNIPLNDSKDLDWKWSELLQQKKIRLFCTTESYIQHIGILGQNNNAFLGFDHGLNFLPENETNQRIMGEFIDELLTENQNFFKQKEKQLGYNLHKITRWDYKIGHAVLALPRELRRFYQRIKNPIR